MITPARIRELLDRRPFRPFHVHLSDGSKHEVPHPEFAWVFGSRVFIGLPSNAIREGGDCVKELAILHVTSIEEVTRPRARKAR